MMPALAEAVTILPSVMSKCKSISQANAQQTTSGLAGKGTNRSAKGLTIRIAANASTGTHRGVEGDSSKTSADPPGSFFTAGM
jgi:hypothetical protein